MAKRYITRGLLLLEVGAFGYWYLCGAHGLWQSWEVQKEARCIQQANACTSAEIEQLEQELYAWREEAFYREKVAREQLQMARVDEIVYFTD